METPFGASGFEAMLDAVVAHLNANGGLPADDRWRRAHAIVERERDTARRERDEAKRNRDEAASRLAGVRDAHQRSADAHMKWKARAEAAERERDEWKQEHDRLVVHGSVRGDTYAAMVRDRDDWRDKAYSASEGMRKATARAEAAEARTDHAVTKAGIEQVIDRWKLTGQSRGATLADDLHALVSGDDPAVFVVRESDVAAVEVERHEDGGWEANGDFIAMRQNTAEALRGWSLGDLQMLARYEAVARAIEAGQATGFGKHHNPAVLVLEDKDIEDVEVKSIDGGRWWLADDTLVNVPEFANEREAREAAEEHLAQAAGAEAVARAIEAEAEPADPVTVKARELAGVMHEAIKDERVEWHSAPAAVDVVAARLAAHVLGQEAGDE